MLSMSDNCVTLTTKDMGRSDVYYKHGLETYTRTCILRNRSGFYEKT